MSESKWSDFTEEKYRELVRLAVKNFTLADYKSAPDAPHMLWRHDVNCSMNRALAMARIEKELGLKATYFPMISSIFYNLFEPEVSGQLREIATLGHDIGLHFDFLCFPKGIDDVATLETCLTEQKQMIERLVDREVQVFSFHNPSPRHLELFTQDRLAGMVNTYGAKLRTGYKYFSDSNGYWRFTSLFEELKAPRSEKIQVLTHPEWWTPGPLSPNDRIARCIDGRAARTLASYHEQLAATGRKNVK